MTPEQITKWAVEVGMSTVMEFGHTRFASPKQLHDFATLVNNAALEKAAVVCEEMADRARTSTGAARADACADRIRSMKHD